MYKLLVLFLLSGCDTTITPSYINKAIEVCEPNDGLSYIYIYGASGCAATRIICQNELVFTLESCSFKDTPPINGQCIEADL